MKREWRETYDPDTNVEESDQEDWPDDRELGLGGVQHQPETVGDQEQHDQEPAQ